MVYADREFLYAVDVLQTLINKRLDYVIPAKKDQHRIDRCVTGLDQVKQGYHERMTPRCMSRRISSCTV